MATTGKLIRLGRFFYQNSNIGLIVPIDHGLTLGPVEGLVSISRLGSWLGHPGITGVIAHKGVIERLAQRGMLAKLGVMLHLNGMSALSESPDRKEMLTGVDTAVRLGADAVSLQVNFDGTNDAHNMKLLGAIVDEAQRHGLPVLTMLYDKVTDLDVETRIRRLRHLMRITVELGSDALKIAAPEATEEIPAILDGIAEDIPIFFAGGTLCSDDDLMAMTQRAIIHGASGLCMGRNVFQRPTPETLLTDLSNLLLSAVPEHLQHSTDDGRRSYQHA